jgi:hypothetical protein
MTWIVPLSLICTWEHTARMMLIWVITGAVMIPADYPQDWLGNSVSETPSISGLDMMLLRMTLCKEVNANQSLVLHDIFIVSILFNKGIWPMLIGLFISLTWLLNCFLYLDLCGNDLACTWDGLFQMHGMAQINLHDLTLVCYVLRFSRKFQAACGCEL